MDEYFCPNCGAVLNDQTGFDPSRGTWTCTDCGTHLMDEDVYDGDLYDGIAWYCDECGSLMNRQSGFSDIYGSWICTECGHVNDINYSQDESNDVEEDEEDEDGQYNNCEQILSALLRNTLVDSDTAPQSKAGDSFTKGHRKWVWGTIIILIVVAGAIFGVCEYQKLIPIAYNSDELIGLDFKKVETSLEEAGFTNVQVEGREDLDILSISKENKVYRIEILGNARFNSNAQYPYDIKIVIKYHLLKRILPPFADKDAKKMNYLDAISEFESAGFVNVRAEAKYDVFWGWFAQNNEVELITINGEKEFDATSAIRPDAEVVILYHANKSEKPD